MDFSQAWLQAIAVVLVLAVIVLVGVRVWREYVRSKRVASIDSALPAALLQAASFGPRFPLERVFVEIEGAGYGALSEEFGQARRQCAAGLPVPRALDELSKRNASVLLSRSCRLLSAAYSSGVDLSRACRALAGDAQELQAIYRERQSALIVQKYTVIAACVLVPLILGTLLAVTSSLDSASALTVRPTRELGDVLYLSAAGYSVLFALTASVYSAFLESRKIKAFLYAAVLVPLSLAAFYAASSFL